MRAVGAAPSPGTWPATPWTRWRRSGRRTPPGARSPRAPRPPRRAPAPPAARAAAGTTRTRPCSGAACRRAPRRCGRTRPGGRRGEGGGWRGGWGREREEGEQGGDRDEDERARAEGGGWAGRPRLQQALVVAHDHAAAAGLGQERGQPRAALRVQVVRRLWRASTRIGRRGEGEGRGGGVGGTRARSELRERRCLGPPPTAPAPARTSSSSSSPSDPPAAGVRATDNARGGWPAPHVTPPPYIHTQTRRWPRSARPAPAAAWPARAASASRR